MNILIISEKKGLRDSMFFCVIDLFDGFFGGGGKGMFGYRSN